MMSLKNNKLVKNLMEKNPLKNQQKLMQKSLMNLLLRKKKT